LTVFLSAAGPLVLLDIPCRGALATACYLARTFHHRQPTHRATEQRQHPGQPSKRAFNGRRGPATATTHLPPPTRPSSLASSNSPSCKVYIESPVVRFPVAMLDGNGDICFPFRHESGMNCEEAGKGGGQGVESAGLACKMWVGRAHGVDFSPLL